MNLLSQQLTDTGLQSSHGQPLNSLVCIRSQPYPALGGSPLRNLQNLEALKKLGSVSLFSLYKGEQKLESYGGLAHWQHCDLNQPQRSPQEKLRNRLRWLRPQGQYYTDWIHTAHHARKFEQFLDQVQPELILLAELWLFPYLPIALAYRDRHPGCQVILDNHNVEALLAQDRYQSKQPASLKEKIDLALNARSVGRMERMALSQVDQVWVCSETDAAAMASLYLKTPTQQALRPKIKVIPNCVDVENYGAPTPAQSGPAQLLKGQTQEQIETSKAPQILFLGSFGYEPNEEAARILIEQVYPKLQQCHPTAQLMLVGRGPKPWMEAAAQANPNIVVTGQVEAVEPYLQAADVMVVPLRQGSGTRLKLLEAFAAKLPVISTYKAAEGLTVIDGQHLLLRDEVDDMVTAIAQLLSSSDLQQQLTEGASQLVHSTYSWSAATAKIQQVLGRSGSVPSEAVAIAPDSRPDSSAITPISAEHSEHASGLAIADKLNEETSNRIAVIIPLHNKAAFIARTLTSVLNQTQPPSEIIVVDDGSKDDSFTVVESWLKEHQPHLNEAQIHCQLIQQDQAGPGAARNRGAAKSTAALLAFLDADDEWMPNFLAEATQALTKHPDCILAAFGQFRGEEKSNLNKRFKLLGIQPGPWRLPLDLSPQVMKPTVDFVFSGATVIRRNGFDELGGFYSQVGCTYGEDTYFWLQAQLRYSIYRNPTALMWYHTECSALGIWNRQAPINPILSQPEALRRSCPEEYALFLERYLAQVAIMTARRFASYGDQETARTLLARFPLSRTFKADHTKANLDILLTNFPELRSWMLKAKFSG